MKSNFTYEIRQRRTEKISIILLLIFLFNILQPITVLALTGGPSQPESQGFEPAGTSDMVDLFSGDFNYNIPLLDVDGYPINISYHSGIGMDQEASWVGLGWNINPGAVTRNVRGIADDFAGDEMKKKQYMKPNRSFGLSFGTDAELFGIGPFKFGNYSLGVKYNNYNGIGFEQSVSISLSQGLGSKSSMTEGLGISSSSDDGVTISPSVSFGKKVSETETKTITASTSINSRGGLKALSISSNMVEKAVKRDGKLAFDFGQSTYTPKVDLPMENYSITGSYKFGGEVIGLHGNITVSGYFTTQKLATNEIDNPAYGFIYADAGKYRTDALMDFNRSLDGQFISSKPVLAFAVETFDTYSVTGQGAGGSYRPFRGTIGHLADPLTETTSLGASLGAEAGGGAVFHGGIDLNVNSGTTKSKNWEEDNFAYPSVNYPVPSNDPLFEKVYFKEAGEKTVESDPTFTDKIDGFEATAIALKHKSNYHTLLQSSYESGTSISLDNYRKKRAHRNMQFSYLTNGEISKFGIEDPLNQDLYAGAKPHHISEITTYGTDGSRYVYGMPLYNKTQEEVTFAVENAADCYTGLVGYDRNVDNSIGNRKGTDNFYSDVITPPFAHSYFLTSVLSSDYIDSDDKRGPSDGDMGNYTKFHYQKVGDFKWRVPSKQDSASYNEGLRSSTLDDKANYIYGEKELRYLDTIETKNHIAIFTLESRADARGVIDQNGGINTSDNSASKLLRKITLYSKPDFRKNPATAIPIQEVHFEYDYTRCPGIDNYFYDAANNHDPAPAGLGGKLTLKKIYFTYGKSNRGRLSPYEFKYNTSNPSYNLKSYDRWGNYKPQNCSGLSNSDFSYVEQNKDTADKYTSSWTLDTICLPSGGKIVVNYESDDYAFVQDKPADQMFVINGVSTNLTSLNSIAADNLVGNPYFYFNLQKNENNIFDENISHYVNNGDLVYYKFLVDIKAGQKEYIPGYAQVGECGVSTIGGSKYGYIRFDDIQLDEKKVTVPAKVCPIVRTAIQYARVNTPKLLWGLPEIDENKKFGREVLGALLESVTSITEIFTGANASAYYKNCCKSFDLDKSWVRLVNPVHKKYGGGCRVKKISMSDEWMSMTGVEPTFSYGQEYEYVNEDGSSTGVAGYEPQIGGDENPWKVPVYYKMKHRFVPDDVSSVEEPFGESLFPSASVGYSKVTVRNIKRENVNYHATGKVVHEFYTAREFPTIPTMTTIQTIDDKTSPFSLKSIFKVDTKDYMTASQGYAVEINGMHGVQKSQNVYAENQVKPISSVEYHYKQSQYQSGSFRLKNNCPVVFSDGSLGNRDIGVNIDMSVDLRESKSRTWAAGIPLNMDLFTIGIIPVVIPAILKSFTLERTQFRSASTTKLIQRFGILEETIAKDLGSTVSTKNLAYDAETGEVLLTQTIQDFNDPVYSLNYPAYWYYSSMAPSSRNQGALLYFFAVGNTGMVNLNNASLYLANGDEVELIKPVNSPGTINGWVTNVTASGFSLINSLGEKVDAGVYQKLKIIRSGYKNHQNTSMATLVSLTNPLQSISSNSYSNVIQASAVEYTNTWRTYCDCFETQLPNPTLKTKNPYRTGTEGYWKPKKSHVYLTERTQSIYDDNTNIRKDGVFTSYTPFYKLANSKWIMDPYNWTFATEVTEFSPMGPELENKDAIGNYSAAEFGYNQSLAVAVSSNARYRDIGYDNFEDYDYSVCADNHFKISTPQSVSSHLSAIAHTGKKSVQVNSGEDVRITRQLENICPPVDPCSIDLCYKITGPADEFELQAINQNGSLAYDWTVSGGRNVKTVLLTASGIKIRNIGIVDRCTLDLKITRDDGCIVSKHLIITRNISGAYSVVGALLCN